MKQKGSKIKKKLQITHRINQINLCLQVCLISLVDEEEVEAASESLLSSPHRGESAPVPLSTPAAAAHISGVVEAS